MIYVLYNHSVLSEFPRGILTRAYISYQSLLEIIVYVSLKIIELNYYNNYYYLILLHRVSNPG
jgi:hypothetical protein